MPPEGEMAAQTGGNNSSDFVRKLYKMLEDPAYASVVRWGDEGDSFVVLENEKFTKTILPKHFKHSNFASFVRQLNKYDFHKVRQNEENGQSPYGAQAWEFKHPEFRADSKNNLDNIRRKAPAPRKPPPAEESFPAAQQVVLLGETLTATQHQVQQLQEQYFNLSQTNKVLVEEIVSLQKMVKAQNQVSTELVSHLNNLDAQRRSNRHSGHSNHSGHSTAGSFHGGGLNVLPDGNDEPPPELRRAREIMAGIEPDQVADREFHRLSVAYQTGSPPDSASSSVNIFSQPSMQPGMMQDPFNDPRHLVYPVGQTQITPPPGKDLSGPLWGPKKPRIFLVEDDKTCSRIGSKFLSQVDCGVEVARDGEEAVNKLNNDPERFDLIFMDIIMPKLDGISATHCIRLINLRVPIVAMTSNIRQEDIASYFQFGMNDVLAKPFTKDGMVRILKKHLPHLLRNPPAPGHGELEANGVMSMPSGSTPTPYAGMSLTATPVTMTTASNNAKFEAGTPIQSPATTGSWHSPGQQMAHTSPNMDGGGYGGGGPQMVLTPAGMQRPGYHPPMGSAPPIARMPDDMGGDRPEKRQRMYGTAPRAYGQ